MSLAMARERQRTVAAPAWPTLMLGLFAVLATLSLLQGVVDVVIPTATGAPSFGFLMEATEAYGPGFFVAYIFVHNLGLACVVPGFGFLAARFEKKTVNRGMIGLLLAGSVVVSLLVAAQYILSTPELFDLPLALTLLAGEAAGVLALSIAAARELRGFVPTPAYTWSLVTPFRRLGLPLAVSSAVLLFLAVWEAWIVFA